MMNVRTRSSLSMSCFCDNILNLVMSNEEGLVENLTVGEPFGTSDHCVIKWDMVIKKIRNKNCNKVICDYFNVDYAQLVST